MSLRSACNFFHVMQHLPPNVLLIRRGQFLRHAQGIQIRGEMAARAIGRDQLEYARLLLRERIAGGNR